MFTMLKINPVRLRKGASVYDPSSGWLYSPALFCPSFRWASRTVERGPREHLQYRYELHTFRLYPSTEPTYGIFRGVAIPEEDLRETSLEFLEGYLEDANRNLDDLKKRSLEVAREKKRSFDPEAYLWTMREGDLSFKIQATKAMLKQALAQKASIEGGQMRRAYPEKLNRFD